MSNVLKFLVVGIVSLSIVLGLVIFILQEPLSNELSKTINPRGSCLEKFDILRNTGIASFSGGDRMTDYQFQTYLEFNKEQCKYYVFKWMPEYYPERNYVEKAWPHEYRLDLTEEVKQELFDFNEKFVFRASDLGKGNHKIGAEAFASWQKHDYTEPGNIKNDSNEIEITIN